MKFNVSYKTISKRGLTSTQVRKVLSETGVSNKDGKKAVSLAINRHRNDLHVPPDSLSTPTVTVVKNSIPKAVQRKYKEALAKFKKEQEEQQKILEHNVEAKYSES